MVKNSPVKCRRLIRDGGLILGSGRPPEEGHGNPLQYFCLEKPMDEKAWQATVHRVAKNRTLLKRLSTHTHAQSTKRLSNLLKFTQLVGSSREGNGTPLQYSCLENPMDGGAWKTAVHGVAECQTRLSDFTFMHWRRKWQPTPVFLPGESQGWGSLVGCHLWGCTESDTTEAT